MLPKNGHKPEKLRNCGGRNKNDDGHNTSFISTAEDCLPVKIHFMKKVIGKVQAFLAY